MIPERIRITNERAQKLLALLDNPEPGLMMWHAEVGPARTAIVELAPYTKKE
jgi:hypothetical protein